MTPARDKVFRKEIETIKHNLMRVDPHSGEDVKNILLDLVSSLQNWSLS